MATISSVIPIPLQPGIPVATSATVVVQGLVNSTSIIKRLVFNNTSGSAVAITVYRVPSGGTPGTGNQIITTRSIPGISTDLAPELASMVLYSNDTIQALAGTNGVVNCFCSGYVAS